MNEFWKPIPSWPGYSASTQGRIRRDGPRGTFKNPRVMKLTTMASGRKMFQTRLNGKRHSVPASVLICEAFHGPRPEGATLVRHLDDVPINNVPGNLAWGDGADNAEDARRNGRLCQGESHGNAKITDADVVQMFKMRAQGQTGHAIGARFSMNRNNVNKILARKMWHHVPIPPDLLSAALAATAANRVV